MRITKVQHFVSFGDGEGFTCEYIIAIAHMDIEADVQPVIMRLNESEDKERKGEKGKCSMRTVILFIRCKRHEDAGISRARVSGRVGSGRFDSK